MTPRKILVVMSTTRWSKRMGEVAVREVEAARGRDEQVELDVLYVVEQDEIDRAARSVGGSGFLGRDVQSSLVATLVAEHERVAERRRARVQAALAEVPCPTTWRQAVGDYEAEVHRAVEQGHYDVVVLVQSKLSFLERLFYGSEDERVARWVRGEGMRVEVEPSV